MPQKINVQQEDVKKLKIAKRIIDEIQDSSSKMNGLLSDGVEIKNVDAIRAAFANELRKLNKSFDSLSSVIEKNSEEHSDLLTNVILNLRKANKRKERKSIEVSNLDKISLPEELKIKNLLDIEPFFKDLAASIEKSFDIEIPEPQVNVAAPIVNVPESNINIPEVDFSGVQDRLKQLSQIMKPMQNNSATKPLAVRLSDGRKYIEQITKELGNVQTTLAGFSDMMRLRNSTNQIINPATNEAVSAPSAIGDGTASITSGGTAQQISATSIPCRRLVISPKDTNTSPIYIGGSTVTSLRGKQLYQGEDFDFEIDDVSKVYFISATTSDSITYMYTV